MNNKKKNISSSRAHFTRRKPVFSSFWFYCNTPLSIKIGETYFFWKSVIICIPGLFFEYLLVPLEVVVLTQTHRHFSLSISFLSWCLRVWHDNLMAIIKKHKNINSMAATFTLSVPAGKYRKTDEKDGRMDWRKLLSLDFLPHFFLFFAKIVIYVGHAIVVDPPKQQNTKDCWKMGNVWRIGKSCYEPACFFLYLLFFAHLR